MQLANVLIYVLLGAMVITALMGHLVDAFIILAVITVDASLGVMQQVKAGNAIAALQRMAAPKALVKRNSQLKEVASWQVVPGDVLVLDAGRQIAADLRLLESASLQIDESALTGESAPVIKNAQAQLTDVNAPPGDRHNMAYMSTLVTAGRGIGIVVATGMQTEVGSIAGSIGKEATSKTPLEIRLEELGRTLGKIAVGVCLAMLLLAYLQGRALADMFLTAVSLAVAAIPEGLAAIVAVVLSIGVMKMARQNAIIKKLPAVETLGAVNVVCSDKTGTLTQNKMTVTQYFTLGSGRREVGPVPMERPAQDLILLAEAMALCSDASYEDGKGTGDPTEIALLLFADRLGIDRGQLRTMNKRIDELAFDSERKLMSTLYDAAGTFCIFTKGAVGSLLPNCTQVYENGKAIPLTDAHRARFRETAAHMSDQALRTLAAAYRPVAYRTEPAEMEQALILLGMVGMMDPPRKEAKEAIRRAREAGVTTIMITGDHKHTAFAIAKELGIATHIGQAISGSQLDQYDPAALARQISAYRVFARVSPQHKVSIVRALKAEGNIVSMTGDGVNDAPSLYAADIGVAMGLTGTDVARNAAHMILTDDNFSTIIIAIEQGRNIYNNIRKSVMFLLACNAGEVIAVVCAILMGWPAPLLATQLLWINLLTDTLPAVALGMDPGNPDVMKEPPRKPGERFFSQHAVLHIAAGGALIGLLTLLAFAYGYFAYNYNPFQAAIPDEVTAYARTMAFMTLVGCQLFYSFSFRYHLKSIFQTGLFSNPYLAAAIGTGVLLQLLLVLIPFTRQAFKLRIPDATGWLAVAVLSLLPLLLSEATKKWNRWQAAMKKS